MKFWIGKSLQVIGMLILPAALYIGIARNQVRLEVQMLFVGGALFLIGRLLTQGQE